MPFSAQNGPTMYSGATFNDTPLSFNGTPVFEMPAKMEFKGGIAGLCACGDLSDISFNVAGEKIPAHSLVLKFTSSVFRQMLESDFEEARTKQINITDASASDIKLFLRFLYGCDIDKMPDENESMALLTLANKYRIPDLVEQAAGFLKRQMTVKNCATFLRLGDMHNCQTLVDAAVAFAGKDLNTLSQVYDTEAFQTLNQDCTNNIIKTITDPARKNRPNAQNNTGAFPTVSPFG